MLLQPLSRPLDQVIKTQQDKVKDIKHVNYMSLYERMEKLKM